MYEMEAEPLTEILATASVIGARFGPIDEAKLLKLLPEPGEDGEVDWCEFFALLSHLAECNGNRILVTSESRPQTEPEESAIGGPGAEISHDEEAANQK